MTAVESETVLPKSKEVEIQLERILAGKAFRRAGRLKRLLRYIVRETLVGRADDLKEYTVAVEVFARKSSFDPRIDAIVRVEARRLRTKLDSYYLEEAESEEMIVEVPKGRYSAIFKMPHSQIVSTIRPASPILISQNSVLVVPFFALSSSGGETSFCGGLHEEIICALSRIQGIRILASKRITWSNDDLLLRRTATDLNASIIVSGSVRKVGSQTRIALKFIDTVTGCYLWSASLDRDISDTFAIQEEIAKKLAEELERLRLGRKYDPKALSPARNLAAYQFYLLGRYHLAQRTEGALVKAKEFFQRAIAEDGQYAQAHSGLADAYSLLGHYGVLSPGEVWTNTSSSAIWAVICDERSAEAHCSLAHVKATQNWDWTGAERDFKRAIELDPSYPTAHHWYGVSLLAPLGRMGEACKEVLLARALDPTSPIIVRDLAKIYYYMGDYEAALGRCAEAIELNPHFAPAQTLLGFIQDRRGQHDQALAAFQSAAQLSPNDPCIQIALGHAYAVSGRRSAAKKVLGEVLELSTKRYVSPLELALLYFVMNRAVEGFHWLERAFRDRSFELALLKVNPRFDTVKDDARFVELLGKLGLPVNVETFSRPECKGFLGDSRLLPGMA